MSALQARRGKSKVVKVKGSRTFKQVWAVLKALLETSPVTFTYVSPELQPIHEYFSLLDEKKNKEKVYSFFCVSYHMAYQQCLPRNVHYILWWKTSSQSGWLTVKTCFSLPGPFLQRLPSRLENNNDHSHDLTAFQM